MRADMCYCCYIKQDEGKPHVTQSEPVSLTENLEATGHFLLVLYANNPTKSAVICGR